MITEPVLDRSSVNLQPGELCLVRSPAVLQTILGSCVSVSFRCARLGIAALCHGVLPECPLPSSNSSSPEIRRYVDSSIRYLACQFDALGCTRAELQVKVFGGADVLPVSQNRRDKPTIGALNARVALQVLAVEGLTVLASDLGGTRGRQIHFYTESGDVIVRRLAEPSIPL